MLEKLCVVVSTQTWINFSFIWMLQQLVRVEKGEWMIKISSKHWGSLGGLCKRIMLNIVRTPFGMGGSPARGK